MSDGLKAQHRAAIIAALAANDRVERAVLFGSRAMGTNTITSDVEAPPTQGCPKQAGKTWQATNPALPARSWAFTESIQPMVDRLTARICDPRTLTTLRNTMLPRLTAGELRGSTQDEGSKAGGKHQ